MTKATEEPGHTRARNRLDRGRVALVVVAMPPVFTQRRSARARRRCCMDEGCLIWLWMPLFFFALHAGEDFFDRRGRGHM